jgi:hypothetical protein
MTTTAPDYSLTVDEAVDRLYDFSLLRSKNSLKRIERKIKTV